MNFPLAFRSLLEHFDRSLTLERFFDTTDTATRIFRDSPFCCQGNCHDIVPVLDPYVAYKSTRDRMNFISYERGAVVSGNGCDSHIGVIEGYLLTSTVLYYSTGQDSTVSAQMVSVIAMGACIDALSIRWNPLFENFHELPEPHHTNRRTGGLNALDRWKKTRNLFK